MRKLRPAGGDSRVLVVDDQEETLTSVRHLLEREGYRVLTAESGERALALLRAHDVAVVLLDLVMPGLSDEDLVVRMRAIDPDVQIVLQTGYAGDKAPRSLVAALDVQGYHDKADGPDALLLWVSVAARAHRVIGGLHARARAQRDHLTQAAEALLTSVGVIHDQAARLLHASQQAPTERMHEPVRAIALAADELVDTVRHLAESGAAPAGRRASGSHGGR